MVIRKRVDRMLNLNPLRILLILIISTPSAALAWRIEGKWKTARFNCSGTVVKVGVDINSRIGGGDATPVRSAYMTIDGKTLGAAWIVGGSMDSVETNNRDHALVTNSSSGTYLQSIGVKNKICSPIK